MNSNVVLRDHLLTDADAVKEVTVLAFQQFSMIYERWDQLSRRISGMLSSTENVEIICGIRIGGLWAVGYVALGKVEADFIPQERAYIRFLVVDPMSCIYSY